MSVEIVFETHSTTTDNEAGIATGWLPGKLSPAGRLQARDLGDRRRDGGFSVVFVSDLFRAGETAILAFAESAIPIQQDARLREIHYGDLDGGARELVDAERPRHIEEPWPGGQSYRDVVRGMASFLEELAGSHDGERVLLIGHSATRFALDHLLTGIRLEDVVTSPYVWQPGWEYALPDGWCALRHDKHHHTPKTSGDSPCA